MDFIQSFTTVSLKRYHKDQRERIKMKFNYIAIEREYASGGSYIGGKTAELLEISCYGKGIVTHPNRI